MRKQAPPRVRLDEEVRDALNRRKGNWERIKNETGISYSWLSKFARNEIKNPGIDYLTRLADLFATGTV